MKTAGRVPQGRAPLPLLPWEEVNGVDAEKVAAELGITPAKAPRKYPCQWCDSSDAMHAYAGGGVHCYSCGRSASNVDLYAEALGLAPADALKQLAGRIGVFIPDAQTPARRSPAPARVPVPHRMGAKKAARAPKAPNAKEAALLEEYAALRADGEMPAEPAEVYAGILTVLQLGGLGAEYLEGRGLQAEAAALYGFRAIPAAEWRELAAILRDSYLPCELALAGLWDTDKGRLSLPWSGRAPALVIPYRHKAATIGLRFRNLTPDCPKGKRYWTLSGVTLALPFNADALTPDGDSGELHICEGELNAYTLREHGLRAIGLPGAGSWRSEWAGMIAGAIGEGRLVAWYDSDTPGQKGRAKLAENLAETLGRPWVVKHGKKVQLPPGRDANDLHKTGTLDAKLKRACWRD